MKFNRLWLWPLLLAILTLPLSQSAIGRGVDKFYYLTPAQTVEYIHSFKGKKAVFLYASWCGYCRKAMPDLITIEKQRPGSVIAVSTDKDPKALLRYLASYPDVPFHVIALKGETQFDNIEARLNVAPREGIPHFILIDGQNIVAASQNMGAADVADYVLRP
ncbi:MAG: TlpA family protein disulfide reductase [Alphaproteobacteria bacterium]|nr:TlpA family protein disulfide reductase [Alphaproteobacteria bacterium]